MFLVLMEWCCVSFSLTTSFKGLKTITLKHHRLKSPIAKL